jgi:hypothetical protein
MKRKKYSERVLHGPGGDTDLDVADSRRHYQWHTMSWWRRTVIGVESFQMKMETRG